MPSITQEKNQEHRQANYKRRNRAYAHLKQVAIRDGWMKHQRDTEGFDRFMDSLERE